MFAELAIAGGAIKIGLDLPGDHKVSASGYSGTEDVEFGFSLTGELFGAVSKNVELGGGLTWQLARSQEDYQGDFNFIPIYGLLRVRSDSKKTDPYLTVQLGYNLFQGDSDYRGSGNYEVGLEGGLYYGIGGGVIFKNRYLIEGLYSVNNGSGEVLGETIDVEYSKISILFGINF